MKLRSLFLAMAMLASTVVLTGCDDDARPLTAAERFVNNLGYNYYLAKDPTASGGGWIVVEHGVGSYYAIDINYWDRWNYSYDIDYFWDYAIPVWYIGGNYYEDVFGNLYEKNNGNSKDLLAVTAKVEEMQAGFLGEKIAAEYDLSVERGTEIGKLVTEYNKLKDTRALTDADADKFSVPVLGFKLSEAMKATKAGDTKAMDAMIEQAADTNDTTPENVRSIMVKFITN